MAPLKRRDDIPIMSIISPTVLCITDYFTSYILMSADDRITTMCEVLYSSLCLQGVQSAASLQLSRLSRVEDDTSDTHTDFAVYTLR